MKTQYRVDTPGYCAQFPDGCLNVVEVPAEPPLHNGGIRCGCAEGETVTEEKPLSAYTRLTRTGLSGGFVQLVLDMYAQELAEKILAYEMEDGPERAGMERAARLIT